MTQLMRKFRLVITPGKRGSTLNDDRNPFGAAGKGIVLAAALALLYLLGPRGLASGAQPAAAEALSGEPLSVSIDKLPDGKSVTVVFQAKVNDPYTGSSDLISNQAVVSGPDIFVLSDDPNTPLANDPTVVKADVNTDLSLSLSSSASSAIPGTQVGFTLRVENSGIINLTAAQLDAVPPGDVEYISWTCTASGGAACAASTGSGSLPGTVDLPAGGSLLYEITALIDPGAAGSLTISASIAPQPPAADSSPGDNSDELTLPLTPQADLAISVTDGQDKARPGIIHYTIMASNAGPSDAASTLVSVDFSAASAAATWTCAPSPGASCKATGSGSINETVLIPASGQVTYTVDLDLTGDHTSESIESTAQVTAHTSVTDPDPSNNTAVDSTELDQPPSLDEISVDPPRISENDPNPTKLTVKFTDYNRLEPHEITVEWGDGEQSTKNLAAGESSAAFEHHYLNAGTYTYRITLTEPDGDTAEVYDDYKVDHVFPDFTVTLDPEIHEGDFATLEGTIHSAGKGDSHTLEVIWRKMYLDTQKFYSYAAGVDSFSETFRYMDDPPGTDDTIEVYVKLQDDDGWYAEKNLQLKVRNVPPVVDAGEDAVVPLGWLGAYYQLNGSFTDPGADSWRGTVDFGDGSPPQDLVLVGKEFTHGHLYNQRGTYTVTVTIEDDDGGVGQDTVQVLVTDKADLSLEASVSADRVLAGSEQVITLKATNHGPDSATGVMITSFLPRKMSFISGSPDCTDITGPVTCMIGDLPAGRSVELQIRVRIDAEATGILTNTTLVYSGNADPDPENNEARVSLRVVPGLEVYRQDFERSAGPEWNRRQTSTTPSGRGFLGEFGNETVTLNLQDLPDHQWVHVTFDLYIIRSWDGNQSSYSAELMKLRAAAGESAVGPDEWMFELDGTSLLHTTFSNWDGAGGTQAYPDSYPEGKNPPRSGAAETGTLGYSFGPIEGQDSVYRLTFSVPHSGGDLRLDFSAMGLQPLEDESWGLDNVTVTLSAGPVYRYRQYFPFMFH